MRNICHCLSVTAINRFDYAFLSSWNTILRRCAIVRTEVKKDLCPIGRGNKSAMSAERIFIVIAAFIRDENFDYY